jgi:polar amino acid transport system substrate-binding protein
MAISLLRTRGNGPRVGLGVVALTCATVSLAAVAQTAPVTLNLVSTPWPPFTNVAGQPRFALDLVEAAFDRIGVKANTRIVSPGEFTTSLLAPTFDGSAAAWKDAERERALIFSQAYLENRLVLVGRRGADVSAARMADLAGKRIAIVEGYSYGESVENAGPIFVKSSSEEDSLSRLLKGTVDYTLMDDLVVEYIVSNHPKEAGTRLQIGKSALVTRPLYLAIRRTRPDAESIVSRFNAQLPRMIADGTYHRLLHVDWIRADINGDGVTEYVPRPGGAGSLEPKRAYDLFSTSTPTSTTPVKTGFYVGGSIYADWAAVPDRYKDMGSADRPDPRRSTASLFKFTW